METKDEGNWTWQVKLQCLSHKKGGLPVGKGKSPPGTSSRSWWGGRSRWGWRWCRGGARRVQGRQGSSRRGWGSSWELTSQTCRTTPYGSCDVSNAFPWWDATIIWGVKSLRNICNPFSWQPCGPTQCHPVNLFSFAWLSSSYKNKSIAWHFQQSV